MSNATPQASRPARRSRRMFAAGALALLALTGPALMPGFSGAPLGVQAASAAPFRVGFEVSYDSPTDPTVGIDTRATIGTLDVRPGSDGNRVICITSGYNDPATLTAPQIQEASPEVGWLINKYMNTLDDVTAAALAEIVKGALDRHPTDRDLAWAAFQEQHPTQVAAVEDRMVELQKEAARNGAYFANPTVQTVDGNVTSGIVGDIGVSNYETWLPGYSTTVTLEGPAVFTETGTNTWTGTTGDSPLSQPITITGPGQVAATQHVTGLPSSEYYLYSANGASRIQDMVGPSNVTSEVTGVARMLIQPNTPVLSSQVEARVYAMGGTPADKIMVTRGTPGADLRVTGTLYGPLSAVPAAPQTPEDPEPVDPQERVAAQEQVTVPEGTPLFDAVTGDITLNDEGAGELVLHATKAITEPGVYVWVESSEASGMMAAASSTFGRTEETSIAPQPTINTQVSEQIAYPGATISDTVEVDGIIPLPGVTYRMTGAVLGPVAPVNGKCETVDWADAPIALAVPETDVEGNGIISGVGQFTVEEPGCYTNTETLIVYDEDRPTVKVVHEAGHVTQTTLVTEPSISTQTSRALAMPGMAVTDSVKVHNPALWPGKMTASLYGPILPDGAAQCTTITDEQWRDAITNGTIKAVHSEEITLTADADKTYVTQPATIKDGPGCYTWYETATFDGPSGSFDTETPYGVESETTLVVTPGITTQAHQSGKAVGSDFTDDIFLTGTHGRTGVITGAVLWRPAGDNNTCLDLDWADAKKVADIVPIPTNGDGTYTSAPIKVNEMGCATFVETWTADDSGDVTTSTRPGEPSETALFMAVIPTGDGIATDGSALYLIGGGLAIAAGGAIAGGLALSRRKKA